MAGVDNRRYARLLQSSPRTLSTHRRARANIIWARLLIVVTAALAIEKQVHAQAEMLRLRSRLQTPANPWMTPRSGNGPCAAAGHAGDRDAIVDAVAEPGGRGTP